MKEYIYKIPVGGNYVKYEVNILTLQDRERDCEGGWTKWRDMCSLSFGFYKVVEPEIFDNRNKLIHGTSRTMERVS
jgi:hypothetical protein